MTETEKPWDAVFNQVRVRFRPECVYPRPPSVTELVLDEIEHQLRSQLPESYRAFMMRFGPGEFEKQIHLECLTPAEDVRRGLIQKTQDRHAFFAREADYFANSAWLCQLVYFGSDGLGDAYAWHPEEVTSSAPHECHFYHLLRADEANPEVVGESFSDFIQWASIEVRARAEEPPTEVTPGFLFEPEPLRLKVKPKHSDVQNWLFFNNRTARLIARSIRDQGRVEAFPILADALQDAGCTNADLLDSCRTGDPDIDGAWVLQVLLGKT